MSILDELDTTLDVTAWDEDTEKRKKDGERKRKGYLAQYKLGEKAPKNVGLINFLSEGLSLNLHTVKRVMKGKTVFQTILCKGQGCELCHAGNEPRRQAVFPLIDWQNSYEDKKSKKSITIPKVKILVKGLNTAKVIERRKTKLGGTLLNKQFEVVREGEGFQTVYDFMPEEGKVVPDFDEVVPGEGGNSTFKISRPETWPEAIKGSIYDVKKLTPQEPLDWSNPKSANKYVQLYFLNQDPADYDLTGNTPSAQSEEDQGVSDAGDDDIPF